MAAEAVLEGGPGGDGDGDGVPALAGLRAAVAAGRSAVADLGLWSVPTPGLRGVLVELETLVRVAQAAQVVVLGEVASRGEGLVPPGLDPAARAVLARSAAGDGRTDLATVLGAHPATAARRQATVAYVTGSGLPAGRASRTGGGGAGLGEGTATGAALADGRVSAEAADVVAATVLDLPEHYGPAGRAAVERVLLEHAPEVPLSTLRFHARGLLARAELTSPASTDGDDDAAGLEGTDLLGRAEVRAHHRRELYCSPDLHGTWHLRGRLAPEAGATLATALQALAAPEPSGEHGPDLRSAPQRRADALLALADKALAAPPASPGGLPTEGGSRTRLVVTVDLAALTGAARGAGLLPDDAPLSPGAVRRLACDAQVVPAVLGTRSEPLDVGRATYTVTPAQRRALVLRDRGCAAPGCTAPPERCHAHHVQHWADGGTTDQTNLVLLCGHHHRRTHTGHLHAHVLDGRPVILRAGQPPPTTAPPPWRARLEQLVTELTDAATTTPGEEGAAAGTTETNSPAGTHSAAGGEGERAPGGVPGRERADVEACSTGSSRVPTGDDPPGGLDPPDDGGLRQGARLRRRRRDDDGDPHDGTRPPGHADPPGDRPGPAAAGV